ncbi:acetyl-CoA carboxylase biotin carboxyl carrier protein [Niallia sp. Krafla_26]|uniref:acetyl-CoA carboxylase biotin carboxyl carrier protein n=1 Tax=Niallia sp. Krafla_26 TaxID=3064703 RepID=UPI003D1721F4
MLKVQEIRELIEVIDQSSIEEFTFEQEGSKIKIKKKSEGKSVIHSIQPMESVAVQQPVTVHQPVEQKQTTPAPAVAVSEQVQTNTNEVAQENLHKITSPMVGTFYHSQSPDADPYVKVGDKVSNDTIVCIVEAMKLFNEIEAEVNGEIVEILVKNGQLVEFGQPLFLVKPE